MAISLIVSNILGWITFINICFIGFIVFYEKKSPVTAIAWILALTYIPVLGFIFYIIFGSSLRMRLNKRFQVKRKFDKYYTEKLMKQFDMDRNPLVHSDQYKEIIEFHFNSSKSICTDDNEVKIYIDAKEKYEDLIRDIINARHNINLSYFIIQNDKTGNRIVDALIKKAAEGVEVKLLYDDVGSAFTPFSMFKELKNAGGHVQKFLPSKLGIININANYRNHRKIAVIDGKIGYIGGMNIGDEYMGLHKRVKPWRDTHLRIMGSSVHMLQIRFLMDWFYAFNDDIKFLEKEYLNKYFPNIRGKGNIAIQIVSSGPDTGREEIKTGFIKMINSAKKSIHIQTPYFIPDAAFLEALKIARISGVEVKIMLPGVPDKYFVFHGTNSYVQDLLECGAQIYMYDGFMHSKVIVIDGIITSVGTTNIDIRSFSLDFEINSFIYNSKFSQNYIEIFEMDERKSRHVTQEQYNSRKWTVKAKEAICRLLSPVL